jgi:hypothetical protein
MRSGATKKVTSGLTLDRSICPVASGQAKPLGGALYKAFPTSIDRAFDDLLAQLGYSESSSDSESLSGTPAPDRLKDASTKVLI